MRWTWDEYEKIDKDDFIKEHSGSVIFRLIDSMSTRLNEQTDININFRYIGMDGRVDDAKTELCQNALCRLLYDYETLQGCQSWEYSFLPELKVRDADVVKIDYIPKRSADGFEYYENLIILEFDLYEKWYCEGMPEDGKIIEYKNGYYDDLDNFMQVVNNYG